MQSRPRAAFCVGKINTSFTHITANQDAGFAKGVVMHMDIEKYRKHLRGLDLPKDHEDEILRFTWVLFQDCVASAFGHHPVQIAQTEKILNTWPDSVKISRQDLADIVCLDHSRLKRDFRTAAAGPQTQEQAP